MSPSTSDANPGKPESKRTKIVIGMALLATVVGSTTMMLRSQDTAPPPERPALEFSEREVTTPEVGPLNRTLAFSGPLVAPETALVRATVAATLTSQAVKEGDRVQAGQVLGRLDLSGLRTQIDNRKASVALARATLDEASSHHKANESLAERQFISSAALRTSRGRVEVSHAELDAARAQLASVQVSEREAALLAPMAGIVSRRHAVPGEKLSENQTIFTIVDLTTLELAGTVPSHEASQVQVGQPVTLMVETGLEPLQGRVQRIAPMVEPGTRAIGVVVVLDNNSERFRAGQYAQGYLEIADPQQRMTVPVTAVGQSSGQHYVWTIEKGRLVRRIVITGRQDSRNGRVEIKRGLAPQAQVLAVRFDNLKEGVAAQVVRAKPAAVAALR